LSKKAEKPLPALDWLAPRLAFTLHLNWILLGALLLLLVLWNALFADLNGARWPVVMAVELAPLLIVLPGIARGRARAHAWLCFVLNLYFIKGVLACLHPARQWLGALEIALSLLLFVSALCYVRWRFQYERQSSTHRIS